MITATHKASRAGDHRYEPSLHLTGCWLPLDSDDVLRGIAHQMDEGNLRLVWDNDTDALPRLNELTRLALRRVTGS
jgi:hypothetical protein